MSLHRSLLSLLSAGVLLGAASTATALPGDDLRGVEIGQKKKQATQAATSNAQRSGKTVRTLSASVAQEYAQALLRSDFLAALNRAQAKHTLLEKPAERDVAFVQGTDERGQVTLAFAGESLEAVFVRTALRPDTTVGGTQNAHYGERLAPLQNYLSSLRSSGCSLDAERQGRNAFVYRGTCSGAAVYVEYRPEHDEFWTVYSAR